MVCSHDAKRKKTVPQRLITDIHEIRDCVPGSLWAVPKRVPVSICPFAFWIFLLWFKYCLLY